MIATELGRDRDTHYDFETILLRILSHKIFEHFKIFATT